MDNKKASVFLASSVERLDVAYAIQEGLQYDVEATVWRQGVFDLSQFTLDDLVAQVKSCDFGIFVFSFEDVSKIREEVKTIRDNVLFELGLFMGALGRRRCYIVMPSAKQSIHIPTDLLGLNRALYNLEDRKDGNLLAALGPVCNQLRSAFRKLGPLDRESTIVDPAVIQQISSAGLMAFYQSRNDFAKYRIDSTLDKYVSTAKTTLHMVSINLITGVTFDGICNALQEKLEAADGGV